jgi:hypothetical protein
MAHIGQHWNCVSKEPHARLGVVLALSGYVDLEFLDPKQILEVLEGSDELLSRVFLACCLRSANGEAGANRLIHPRDVISGVRMTPGRDTIAY